MYSSACISRGLYICQCSKVINVISWEKSLGLNGLLDRIDVRNKQDDRQIVHCPRTTHIE